MSRPPKPIIELVERFERNIESYRATIYKEAQLRAEFINPMFEALGWDVQNKSSYAEPYKDVIHEDAIQVGGATKAPDYCFRIGGTRKFFLEAKKPSVDIKGDVSPAYQLRRYAWSSKLPLSILTDFEEFAVYDCRIRPKPKDKVSTGRILYLGYQDYSEKWNEIASVFSREAVLKGSFDKYAETARGKRGTSEVDAEFLKEIEQWRDALARNLALRNPKLSVRQLNFAVQRTIDRIIFLRMCEDRGIEPHGRLHALVNGTRTYRRLLELFYHADDRYNSGLFHFKPEKDRPGRPDDLTPDLKLDDKVLKSILAGLYYPDCPYEFSVLPPEILGNVYEQFLGKVIRLTAGHQARVEEKPEVKKAGGVYYTPKYIVDYIVKNTVGKLLEKKTPRQAAKLKILDPACGSGSFLIGAYQHLLDWYRDKYVKDGPAKHRKQIHQGRGGQWFLTTAEKKRILLDNIYGVDIDPQAVEVTKLSLLLRVLEGESGESLSNQLRIFHQRALPDLSDNIKCGNSLIGPNFYEGKQLGLFDDEERLRINAFDWHAEFPQVFHVAQPPPAVGHVAQPPPAVRNVAQPPPAVRTAKPAKSEYRRNLPHLQAENKTLYVTFSTRKRRQLPESVRDLVLSHCLHEHGTKIWVHGVVVMPDHVHMVFTPLNDEAGRPFGLAEIMNGIKGASAHAVNKALRRKGSVWQDESFDHVLRSDENARAKVEYICQNPVRKGLARDEDEYPWLWREWIDGNESQPRAAVPHTAGGFDAVIGNPPYGASLSPAIRTYLAKRCPFVSDFETSQYFFGRASILAKRGAHVSFIVPNTLFLNLYARKFRRYLTEAFSIIKVADMSGVDVFEGATVRTTVPFLIRAADQKVQTEFIMFSDPSTSTVTGRLDQRVLAEDDGAWIPARRASNALSVVDKARTATVPLGDIVAVSQGLIPYDRYRGHDEYTIKNRIWHADRKKDKTYKRELRGRDVKRYFLQWNGKRWISYGPWLAAPRRSEFFNEPRLLFREITDPKSGLLHVTYTKEEFYNNPAIINCILREHGYSLLYLLGIVNSRLMAHVHYGSSPKARKGVFPKILVNDVRKLPIRPIDFSDAADSAHHDRMVKLVEQMLDLHKRLAQAKTPDAKTRLEREIKYTDDQIDRLVYELYGLSDEEIRIVEEGTT